MSPSFGSSTELASAEGMSGVRGSSFRQQTLNLAPIAYWRLGEPIGYRAAVLATAPVGYWRLGESSGTNAVDEMGASDGTYINTPTLATAGLLVGDTNTSVAFAAASSEQATMATYPTTDLDNLTMVAWVIPTTSATSRCIMSTGDPYALFVNSSHKLWGLADSANVEVVAATGTALSTSVASMVAFVRRSGTSYTYLNGVLDVTGNTTEATATAGTAAIGSNNAVNFPFDGAIDEVAYWNRALTSDELSTLYAAGMNAVTDEMGSYDGTYVNTPTLATAGLLAGDADTAVALARSDAVTQRVEMPLIVLSGSVSVAAWINNPSNDGSYTYPLSGLADDANGARFYTQNATSGFVMGGSGLQYLNEVLTGLHFIVLVTDDAAATCYIDARLAIPYTAWGSFNPAPATGDFDATTMLGTYADYQAGWGGTIDEVAIWNRALTAGEIKLLYQTGKSGSQI